MAYNELTVDNIAQGIAELIRAEAWQEGGPSLGKELLVTGLVRCDDLRRVLEVKGELVIRIKGIPDQLVGIDDDAPLETDGIKRMKELARMAGARQAEAPLSVD